MLLVVIRTLVPDATPVPTTALVPKSTSSTVDPPSTPSISKVIDPLLVTLSMSLTPLSLDAAKSIEVGARMPSLSNVNATVCVSLSLPELPTTPDPGRTPARTLITPTKSAAGVTVIKPLVASMETEPLAPDDND